MMVAGRTLGRIAMLLVLGLAVGSAVGAPVSAQTPQLMRYPYLTDVTTSSVTVNFATLSINPHPQVLWGAGPSCTAHSGTTTATAFTVSTATEYQHRGTITGLQPNTTYCYRVSQSGTDLLGAGPSPSFVTALPAGSAIPFRFAVFGDWGDTSQPTGTGVSSREASIACLPGPRYVTATCDLTPHWHTRYFGAGCDNNRHWMTDA